MDPLGVADRHQRLRHLPAGEWTMSDAETPPTIQELRDLLAQPGGNPMIRGFLEAALASAEANAEQWEAIINMHRHPRRGGPLTFKVVDR